MAIHFQAFPPSTLLGVAIGVPGVPVTASKTLHASSSPIYTLPSVAAMVVLLAMKPFLSFCFHSMVPLYPLTATSELT